MTGPGVSDHALLRFLQRTGSLDVEALRSSLSQSLARAHQAARSISAADYVIRADGLVFVVRGDVVTTMFEERSPHETAMALRPGRVGPARG